MHSIHARAVHWCFVIWCGVITAIAAGCGAADDSASGNPSSGADTSLTGTLGGSYDDLPAASVLADAVPAEAPDRFGAAAASATGGPCLIEPEIGALYPRNWQRPRFRWTATADQSTFELRIHVENQKHDLLVYTSSDRWVMPKEMWQALAAHSAGSAMSVRVRSATSAWAVSAGSEGRIDVAPVDARGTVVYWTTSGGTVLKGFTIGDETVQTVLTPRSADAGCVGCHTSTPDGLYLGLSAAPGSDGMQAHIDLRAAADATTPSYLTSHARALLARTPQHLPVFSKTHYSAGDRVAITMRPVSDRSEILWTDLEATSEEEGIGWGIFARTGDARHAAAAAPSHDGRSIVYVSAGSAGAGTVVNDGDLYTIPYGDRAGGSATPLRGAAEREMNEYYPALSPDDTLVAFSRAPTGLSSYDQAQGEVLVVPAKGGDAVRLAANDPPACTGRTSPGVTNAWPKWSPEVASSGGKDYYFLVFSSKRGGERPQLYATAIEVAGSKVTTHSAIYLWNQPEEESNHTPSWEVLTLPPAGTIR